MASGISIGDKIGRLLVIGGPITQPMNLRRPKWACECSCGRVRAVDHYSLRRRVTQSCGCLAREIARAVNSKPKTNDVKEKIRLAKIGTKLSDEHRAKIARAGIGKKGSEKQKIAARAANKRRVYTKWKHSPETIRKMSERNSGSGNAQFNPDRDAVMSRYKTARFMRQCVRRLRISKGRSLSKNILGYTNRDLTAHIEMLFKDGMTWQNHGDWHIDHIRPIVDFTVNGITEPAIICALENLQPLWKSENLRKGAKWRLQ